jgi:hypothetical protein
MHRPPRRKGKRLFGKMVFWHCVFVSGIMVVAVLCNFAYTLAGVEKGAEDYRFEAEKEAEKMAKAAAEAAATGGRRAVKVPVTKRLMEARAVAFNMLVFAEMAYALNCRFLKESAMTFKLFTDNKWCWISIGITTTLQLFLTYTPGVNEIFSNGPISGQSWGLILVCSLAVFILVEMEKAFGIKYVMPHIKRACQPLGCCTGENEHERTQSELNQVNFIASGAHARRLRRDWCPAPRASGPCVPPGLQCLVVRLVRPLLTRPRGSLQFHRPRAMKWWELVGASKMNVKAGLLGVPLFESTSLSPLLLPSPFSVTETSSRQHRVTQVLFRFVYVTQGCLCRCLCTCVSLKRASRTQPASYRGSRRKPADRVRQALPFYPPQPGLDSDQHWQAAPRRAVLRSASMRRAAPL